MKVNFIIETPNKINNIQKAFTKDKKPDNKSTTIKATKKVSKIPHSVYLWTDSILLLLGAMCQQGNGIPLRLIFTLNILYSSIRIPKICQNRC